MQQPPQGRPLPGQQPQRPPAYVPPPQQPQPPQQQRPTYSQQPPQPQQYQQPYQPPVQQPPATPLPPPAKPKKSRGSLRFLAATCVFSGWVTLVLSIVFAIGTFMAGASAAAMLGAADRSQQYFPPPSSPSMPSMPSPMDPSGGLLGGEGGLSPSPLGGGGGPFTGMASLLQKSIPALSFAGGVFTLVTGVVSFLLFLGLGQVCYVLLDLEEQQGRMENMLQVLSLRPHGR